MVLSRCCLEEYTLVGRLHSERPQEQIRNHRWLKRLLRKWKLQEGAKELSLEPWKGLTWFNSLQYEHKMCREVRVVDEGWRVKFGYCVCVVI